MHPDLICSGVVLDFSGLLVPNAQTLKSPDNLEKWKIVKQAKIAETGPGDHRLCFKSY